MSLYVAAYDVTRNSRRARVAEILLEYGRRVQRSVFEIDVEPEDLDELRFRVGVLLAKTDAFDLFPIDRRFPKRRSLLAARSGRRGFRDRGVNCSQFRWPSSEYCMGVYCSPRFAFGLLPGLVGPTDANKRVATARRLAAVLRPQPCAGCSRGRADAVCASRFGRRRRNRKPKKST